MTGQGLAKHQAAAQQPRLQSRQGNAQDGGGLGAGQLLDVPQQEGRPVRGGQSAESLFDEALHLRACEASLRVLDPGVQTHGPEVLLPIFLDFPVGSLLNATHRAHLKTSAMVGTMVVNILLNTLLVPSLGPVGAAWAGVFSFWFLFLIGAVFTVRDAGGWLAYGSIIGRSLLAAAGSWAAWRIIGDGMPFAVACIFGGAVALVLALLLRLVTLDDLKFLVRLRGQSPAEEDIHAES